MSISLAEFKTLSLPQMKTQLRELKLHITGPKARLIERYETYLSDRARLAATSKQNGADDVYDGLERLARDHRILLLQLHPDSNITAAAQTYLFQKVKFLLSLFLEHADVLMDLARGRTYSTRIVQTVCRIKLGPEISSGAMAMATRTLALYFTTSNEKVDGKRRRILDKNKAGLILRPSVLVAVVRRMVRRDQDDLYHISKGFTLYLTAVIQYIMSKILESAGDVAHSEQRVRITSAHLDQVLLNELNLFHLFTTRVNPTFDSEVDRLLRLKYKESAPI